MIKKLRGSDCEVPLGAQLCAPCRRLRGPLFSPPLPRTRARLYSSQSAPALSFSLPLSLSLSLSLTRAHTQQCARAHARAISRCDIYFCCMPALSPSCPFPFLSPPYSLRLSLSLHFFSSSSHPFFHILSFRHVQVDCCSFES